MMPTIHQTPKQASNFALPGQRNSIPMYSLFLFTQQNSSLNSLSFYTCKHHCLMVTPNWQCLCQLKSKDQFPMGQAILESKCNLYILEQQFYKTGFSHDHDWNIYNVHLRIEHVSPTQVDWVWHLKSPHSNPSAGGVVSFRTYWHTLWHECVAASPPLSWGLQAWRRSGQTRWRSKRASMEAARKEDVQHILELVLGWPEGRLA